MPSDAQKIRLAQNLIAQLGLHWTDLAAPHTALILSHYLPRVRLASLGQVLLPSAVGAIALSAGAAGVLCATAAALAALAAVTPLARQSTTGQDG